MMAAGSDVSIRALAKRATLRKSRSRAALIAQEGERAQFVDQEGRDADQQASRPGTSRWNMRAEWSGKKLWQTMSGTASEHGEDDGERAHALLLACG